ncbi:MAG: carbohydrate binding family 9 domain-containing protein [Gemmatimonadota bacterium]|nr:carbohydrate binding family 9 domain-containing protein [Gemmatimonadota bacterium]
MLAILALVVSQQGLPAAHGRDSTPPSPTTRAVLAAEAPVIDGHNHDAIWRRTQAITDFQEWSPTEGKAPRFPTEAHVAYDRANLYVFVRCFDPAPDSLTRLIGRRDDFPESDRVIVLIDSYLDRRTGYEFGVTAAGGRYDAAIYNDGNEDEAWDAVWDVATRIDSLGWTAEFRIPLSQLRYGPQREHTFGFAINRDLHRYSERISWPLLRRSAAGLVSQFTEITGFNDLEAPRRLEAAPYVVTKNISRITEDALGRTQEFSLGADLKYRVASNLTLDATINPDFGQVEADPGVLNLTAYETFFPEKRPFFVAGRGLFQVSVNCNSVNCSSEGLFYSRRIGRAPTLAGAYGDTTSPAFTTILGAGKLTGRLAGGLRIGVLEVVTAKTAGVDGQTIEPLTNYGVVRLDKDYHRGDGAVGAMVTAVNRHLDTWSEPYLPHSSYAGAVTFRQRFLNRTYELSGLVAGSRVSGEPSVIDAIQRSPVHSYQRPDAGLPYDPTRTVLGGDAEELKLGKVAGRTVMFETAWQRRSPGFEVNDLGYLQRAGSHNWNTWVGFFDRTPRRFYRDFQWNWNWWQIWTTEGLPLERAANTNLHVTLKNNWSVHAGGTLGQLGSTYDDRLARGGPAVRQDRYLSSWAGIVGDDRARLVPELFVNFFRGGAGHSRSVGIEPELDVRLSSRLTGSLSLDWSKSDNGYQWWGNVTDSAGVTHYGFARLRRTTTGITARVNYTISPVMTLQVYAQPFVSKGTYSELRELSATPRAAAYDDRYQPYYDAAVAANPGGFNYKQFRSNVVFRWEYLPGSILFVVWTQGREGVIGEEGTTDFLGDLDDLFRLPWNNTFLVKVSYWLNR